jgi:beta-galactosidase
MWARCLRALAIAFGALFMAQAAAQTAPRTTTQFDQDWRYWAGDAAGVEQSVFDDGSWAPIDLPHDWSIAQAFDERAPAGGAGGFLPTGVVWYRKSFTLPASATPRRYYIEFDGVMANSGVWINGHHLGHRPYGYIGFRYDLTPHLRFDQPNVIAVRADTSAQPASRWYAGTGIYRHVRLVETGAVHLEHWGPYVTTPSLSDAAATVRVQSEIVNDSGAAATVRLEITLLAPDGRVAGEARSTDLSIAAGRTETLSAEATLASPERWDMDHPALYRAIVRVANARGVLDEDSVTFGIRDARFEAETGFWLNGRRVKLNGVAIHADGGAVGAAVPLAVWEQRLTALRALGVNSLRMAHNPPTPEALDLMDRMGFLVMDELFDQWNVAKTPHDYHFYFSDWHRRDTRDIIRRDRNHPSIILWSAGNEIHDTAYPLQSQASLRSIMAGIRAEDTTRPITLALFRPNVTGDYHNGLADMLDVVGQNYRENELIAAHEQNRARRIVGTENGKGRANWVAVRDYEPYSGMFLWTGVDYMGEADRRRWPFVSNAAGLLDRTGDIKISGMERASWWATTPVVHVVRNAAPPAAQPATPVTPIPTEVAVSTPPAPNTLFNDWNPADLGPHPETIEVYSNCANVDVLLNGRSLGAKPLPADASPRQWAVTFERGDVRARCLDADANGAEDVLRTAGAPARIELSLDGATSVGAQFDDLGFVRARVVDRNGVIVPGADTTIRFTVSRAGALVATDNADDTDHTLYASPERRAFRGRALALVRAAEGASGAFTVTASARGLRSATLSVPITAER